MNLKKMKLLQNKFKSTKKMCNTKCICNKISNILCLTEKISKINKKTSKKKTKIFKDLHSKTI